MKRLTFILIFLFAATISNAAVFTVSNNPSSPAQYTTIQAACDVASAGDTIYISGSLNNYTGGITLRKKLTLIGPGAFPAKQNSLSANIFPSNAILFDSLSNVYGASGCVFIGLNFFTSGVGLFSVTGAYSNAINFPNNIIFKRNRSSGSGFNVQGNNWEISENLLRSLQLGNKSFCIVRNNIFVSNDGSISLNNSNQPNVLIDHNTFIGSTGQSNFLSSITNALFTNNIFQSVTPVSVNVTNCIFNNNLTYLNTNNNLPTGTNNTGSGNIINQNPLFVNVPNSIFNPSYDYRLQDSSPGKNAGTDGTDLGVFGGNSPMLDISGMSDLPYIREMNIENSTIGIGTNLNVQVKARKR